MLFFLLSHSVSLVMFSTSVNLPVYNFLSLRLPSLSVFSFCVKTVPYLS